jgi:aryl carrier-like protein
MPVAAIEQELMDMITESVEPSQRRRVTRSATLLEIGMDSLTLMIVLSQFLERYPGAAASLQGALPKLQTVADLVEAGRTASECAGAVGSNV